MFKSRKMINNKTGEELNIIGHVMLKNFWEYYITDDKIPDTKIHRCLVMGFETEIGDVDLDEIKPYAISVVSADADFFPAEGWSWAN